MVRIVESNFKNIVNNSILLENLITDLNVDVYPITLAKLLICKEWIKNCFTKENKLKFDIDNNDCEICKKTNNICRQHRSINRVMNANSVLYISDMECYLYKNEIFKTLNDKLIIIYCSHTKLIKDEITEEKVKKLLPITVYNPDLPVIFPKILQKTEINSNTFINKRFCCWFNKEFSIVINPYNVINSENNNKYRVEWYLIPNIVKKTKKETINEL